MPMTRPASRLLALLAAMTVSLAACAGGGADPTEQPSRVPTATATPSATAAASESAAPTDDAGAGAEVLLGDMSYSPGELTVSAGTTVTFTNGSSLPHTVTHGTGGRPAADAAFDKSVSPDGGTVEITFDEPGTYDITCKLHPTMQMRVVVEG